MCFLVSCDDAGYYDAAVYNDNDALVSSNPPGPLRIYSDPYGEVDWSTDLRLLAQHHDHVATSVSRLLAYDQAGYDVVSLMDYSGAPSPSSALTSRPWPPESVLSSDVLAQFQHIDILIPNAEEVGITTRHYTSPFLMTYIEYSSAGRPAQNQYSNEHQLAELIRAGGGLPVLAHPWYSFPELIGGPNVFGLEIYSAYVAAKRQLGDPNFVNTDVNEEFVAKWDAILSTGRWWIGIAVNDHFGPYPTALAVDQRVRDSGKILVLSKAATLDAYRQAFASGALFAIRDDGVVKGAFPTIDSILVGPQSVSIQARNATSIRWVSMGQSVGFGADLQYGSLPSGAVYLRAEVRGEGQTVVFTQPFVLRHVDDIDGDGLVGVADQSACEATLARIESNANVVRACTR
jgi:hypothetical protein